LGRGGGGGGPPIFWLWWVGGFLNIKKTTIYLINIK